MKRACATLILVAAFALAIMTLAGCGGPDQKPPGQTGGDQLATSTPGNPDSPAGDAVPGATSIPPGRSFSEGGGGPKSYTFREEWRRASVVARQWREGAYLVTASGQNVNVDGVPSSWTMMFVDAIPTDEILFVEIDPWGAVTKKRTVKTAEVTDQLQPGDDRIPFGILDSDAAVTNGKDALSTANLPVSGNARLTLSYFRDGSGPFWSYIVEGPSPSGTIVRVNANTGEAVVLSK